MLTDRGSGEHPDRAWKKDREAQRGLSLIENLRYTGDSAFQTFSRRRAGCPAVEKLSAENLL
jgi:hypothetical protein